MLFWICRANVLGQFTQLMLTVLVLSSARPGHHACKYVPGDGRKTRQQCQAHIIHRATHSHLSKLTLELPTCRIAGILQRPPKVLEEVFPSPSTWRDLPVHPPQNEKLEKLIVSRGLQVQLGLKSRHEETSSPNTPS